MAHFKDADDFHRKLAKNYKFHDKEGCPVCSVKQTRTKRKMKNKMPF